MGIFLLIMPLAQTWLAGPEFNMRHFQNITAIATYGMHVAPGRALAQTWLIKHE